MYVPAKDIPVPTTISSAAQAMLALGRIGPVHDWPDREDTDGWKALIARAEAATRAMTDAEGQHLPATSEAIEVAGVRVYVVTPDGVPDDDPRVYLYLHGGAFIQDGGEICRFWATSTAVAVGARVWAVDYRMPPEDPYPAPLDDCVAVYRALLADHRPEDIIIEGPSAGGNLAAATILRARDEGLPLPGAAVLFSPELDLTEAGDSFQTNLGLDTVLVGSLMPANRLYAAGHDLRDPYLSPIYGDLGAGFPATMLVSGTRDMFLSNTVRMHRALRAAGVAAELHVWEAAGHAMFLGKTPEDADRAREVRRFVDETWARANR
ncbi:alpha/beta hydrolase [Nocardia sp. BMG111209]|uniref:alpha/beta hydrolase n=1 Tax=Nocardia sp. BMG111209 TaxID=1160137 RepID=UPI0003808348|nr:alpha/beta hydrolase [Nocardia sp. BMG111209]